MKHASFMIGSLSAMLIGAVSLGQTPGTMDDHIAAAKAAAGLDYRGRFAKIRSGAK